LSSGPQLLLEAQEQNGTQRMMGDTVTQQADVTVRWQDCPADSALRILANGQLLHQQATGGEVSLTWPISPSDAHWLTAEVRSAHGMLLAITNPIYFE
jgi:hypothetical protein